MNENDRVRVTYDQGYGASDWGVRYCIGNAIELTGARDILTETRLPADQELALLKTKNISMIMGTSSYLHTLSNDLEKLEDLKKLNIKSIMVGTEPLSEAVRKKLENIWNTEVFQGYGLIEMGTSIAGECKEKNGMHLTETDFFVEVIDPETGGILEDGKIGELVFTTLSREGMPLIRYRTHDLGVVLTEECPCGLPFRRIKIKGRTDKMIIVGSGDKIYPNTFDETILSISKVNDYQITLDRKNNRDHITVVIETDSINDKVKKEVMDALLRLPEIKNGIYDSKTIEKPEIKLVKPHTLDRTSLKAKRVIDSRKLYE
jgi:phenylacetate-CoA ligase